MAVNYDDWISRERRIRARILRTSPSVRATGACRVCRSCREICLCHEIICPNCGGDEVVDERVQRLEEELRSGERIRCRYRFEHLENPSGIPDNRGGAVTALDDICISCESTIRYGMECIDRNSRGIVLVCDHERRLLGTVTDGDIRRAMLVGENLDATITRLLDLKKQSGRPGPVVAGVDSNPSTLLQIMQEKMVRQIPLLDADGKVEDLVTLEELLPDGHLPLQAMIMAGGFGKRLRPLTEHLPKPMLPIGDRPLIERIVQQLQQAGIHRVNLATHYKGEVIEDHLGDGSEFGVEINYVREDEPLGTAGALCLLEESDQPLLVINGDILTGLDFRAMLDFHWEHDAAMTVAVREHDFHLPYGVVDTRGVEILGIKEKPVVKHFVNAGIYLLDSRVCRLIPPGRAYDIPDLIEQLINENQRVVSFLIREYWQDIGEIGDYEKAMADFSNNEV